MADSASFPARIGGSGRTYTADAHPDTGMFDGGHRRNLIPMMHDAAQAASFTSNEAAASKASRDAAEQFLRAIQDVARETGAVYQPLAAPMLDVDFDANACRYFDGKKQVTKTIEEAFSFQRASSAWEFGPSGRLVEYAANEPAFAFDPETGEALGAVIRGDFTNHLVYSRMQGGWNTTNLTAVDEEATTFSGERRQLRRWIPNRNNANHYLYSGNNTDVVPGKQYTISVCIPNAAPYRGRFIFRSSNGSYPDGSGVFSSSDAIERANGWRRFSYTFTTPDDCRDLQIRLYLYDNSDITFEGDGERGVLLDHMQMVEGDQAGPIIPTSNAPVTRSADRVMNLSGINIREDALTIYVETLVESPDNFRGNHFTLSSGSGSNVLTVSQTNSTLSRLRWYVDGNSVDFTFRTPSNDFNKIAVSFDSSGVDVASNGDYEGRVDLTDPARVNILGQLVLSNLRTRTDSYQTVNKKIRRLTVYPRVLSNADKQGLTT